MVPIPSRSFPRKKQTECVFYLWPSYKVPHCTSQLHITRNVAADCYAKTTLPVRQAGTVLLQSATGDTENLFACRRCRIESLYKADGNLHVQYIPISSYSHSVIPIPMKGLYVPIPMGIPHSCSRLLSREFKLIGWTSPVVGIITRILFAYLFCS